MKHCTITLPQEIVSLSNIDFSRPVYLHSKSQIIYLSNKKERDNLIGKVNIDDNYTFTLHQDSISQILHSKNYMVYIKNGRVFIASASHPVFEFAEKASGKRTFYIPKEILYLSKIDITKPTFLYMPAEHVGYLSNKKKRDKCLGTITFDETSFYLSNNICKSLEARTADDLYVYVSKGIIFFKTSHIYLW